MTWKHLDRLGNIAAVLGLVLVLIVLFRPKTPNADTVGPDIPYPPGSRAPEVANISYERADTTVLLFISSHCSFCEASMSFYRSLIDRASTLSSRTQFVVLSRETPETLAAYVQNKGLRVSQTETLGPGAAKGLKYTPTVVLVDAAGKVRKMWVGRLDPAGEQEVVASLGTKPRPSK